jgi:hypothetical protein
VLGDQVRDGANGNLRAALRVADLLDGDRAQDGSVPAVPERGAVTDLFSGALPTPQVWRHAWHEVLTAESARVTTSGLSWILTSLARGAFPALEFLEIGCERIRLSRLSYGSDGAEAEIRTVAETDWTDLVPTADGLPDGRLRRLLLLAGGTDGTCVTPRTAAYVTSSPARTAAGPGAGAMSPGAVPADLAASLGRHLRAFVREWAARSAPLVLVVRAAGWSPVERAAEALNEQGEPLLRLRLPVHWPQTPGDLVAGLPLRYPIWLAGAHIDGTSGTVGLVRRLLFPAGSRPAEPAAGPVVRVPVAAPPGAATAGHSVAAVVSAGEGEPPSRWRPVRVDRLELSPGARVTLRYRLTGPGRVEFDYEGRHEPETSPWAALAVHTPRRLSRPRPVDLVLAVETAGPQADGGVAVEERLQEAAAVVAAVRDAVGDDTVLRVGLIGYRDHAPLDRRHHSDPLVHRVGLSSATSAAKELADWQRTALRHDFATGLEHVPHELAHWSTVWRPESHRVLLVLGSRPPHPHSRPPQVLRRGAAVRICPDRVEWERALESLRHYDGVHCVAVVDEPSWMDRLAGEPHLAQWANRAWDLFGAEGRFAAGHDPRFIASAVAAPALCRPEDGTPIRLVVTDGAGGDWLPAAG